jgi:hypothetical protein
MKKTNIGNSRQKMLAVIAVLRFSNKYCPQLYTDNIIIA